MTLRIMLELAADTWLYTGTNHSPVLKIAVFVIDGFAIDRCQSE